MTKENPPKELKDANMPGEPQRATGHSKDASSHDTGQNDAPRSEAEENVLAKIAQLEAEKADLHDRLLRALADTENLRRRAERDVDDTRQYAVTQFAGDMIRVADNMERAIASLPAEDRPHEGPIKTLIDGVELTEKEMLRLLKKHGVNRLQPVGERFDPNFHEALFETVDPSMPHGTVVKVVEPGYSIGGRPLRPAKVTISRGGPRLKNG